MKCEHAPSILPLTWHGELGYWECQGGPGALQRSAAQPTMAEMVSTPLVAGFAPPIPDGLVQNFLPVPGGLFSSTQTG